VFAQGRAAFAQAARVGRAEAEQGLLHPLVQQDGVDLVGEAAVEPGGQAARLGALCRIGGHQEGRLLLSSTQPRMALASHRVRGCA
jgi:hypothetical protein